MAFAVFEIAESAKHYVTLQKAWHAHARFFRMAKNGRLSSRTMREVLDLRNGAVSAKTPQIF